MKINNSFFIIIIFFVFNYFSYAQSDSLKVIKNYNFLLKLEPYRTIVGDGTTNSHCLQICLETIIKKKISFNQDIGYIFYQSAQNYGSEISRPFIVAVKDITGIRTESEIRYYISRQKKKLCGYYIAANLIYQFTKAKRGYTIFYKVNRNMYGLHGKIGWQNIAKKGKGFIFNVFDFSCGIGLRYISSYIITSNFENSESYEFIYKKHYDYGSKLFPSFTFSIKLGWAFNLFF